MSKFVVKIWNHHFIVCEKYAPAFSSKKSEKFEIIKEFTFKMMH